MAVASILERSTPVGGGIYVRVAFWEDATQQARGIRFAHIESFHFVSMQTTKETPQLDGNGHWLLVAGGTFDPATETELNPAPSRSEVIMDTIAYDPKPEIFATLRKYATKLTWPAAAGTDRSEKRYSRDEVADPRGLLTATSDLSLEGI